MRSVTSFFDKTLYKKDIFRFWPLWVIYAVIWLFLLPLNLVNEWINRYGMSDIAYRLERWVNRTPAQIAGGEWGVVFALFVGILGAMAVWSYLYNTRSANAMHALPVRREGHFVTHYLAVVTMFTGVHLFTFVVTALVEMACGAVNLGILAQAMGYMTLMCLFYFSFATLCAMLTGHILMLPVFYGIFNVLAIGLAALVDWLGTFFLYGYTGGLVEHGFVEWLTPVAGMMGKFGYDYPTQEVTMTDGSVMMERVTDVPFFTGGWVLWVYAAIGLLLAALALVFYRRRHLETAGDVVAVLWMRPVFLYCVAFCTGLAGGCFTCEVFGLRNLPFLLFGLLLWGIIGYFAALMLLNKSFKVLRKGWKGCVATVLGFMVICGIVHFDLFGVEARVPNADNVVSVTARRVNSFPDDAGDYLSSYEVTDPAFIEKVIAVHENIVEDRKLYEEFALRWEYGSYTAEEQEWISRGLAKTTNITISYQLKNGRTMQRTYNGLWLDYYALQDPTSLESHLTELINDRETLYDRYNFDLLEKGKLVAVSMDCEHLKLRTGLYTEKGDIYFGVPYFYEEKELTWEEAEKAGYYIEDYAASVAVPITEGIEQQGTLIELEVTEQQAEKLRLAILSDFRAGRLGEHYLFSADPELVENTFAERLTVHFEYEYTESTGSGEKKVITTSDLLLALTSDAVETIAVLTEMGAFDEGGMELRTQAGTVAIP